MAVQSQWAKEQGERIKKEGWRRAVEEASDMGYGGEKLKKRAASMWQMFIDEVLDEELFGHEEGGEQGGA